MARVLAGIFLDKAGVLPASLATALIFKNIESDCLTRQCCGPLRPFEMTIEDNMQREVNSTIIPIFSEEIHSHEVEYCYQEFQKLTCLELASHLIIFLWVIVQRYEISCSHAERIHIKGFQCID